jgi:hypothetical protein
MYFESAALLASLASFHIYLALTDPNAEQGTGMDFYTILDWAPLALAVVVICLCRRPWIRASLERSGPVTASSGFRGTGCSHPRLARST